MAVWNCGYFAMLSLNTCSSCAAVDQLHDSAPEYAGALLSVFPEARAIVETEIENMLNGKESAEDAVSKMASDMNKSIEDYNLLNE